MNAGIGASRAAIDMGWADSNALIGMSGQTVAPQVYIAFGVSGVLQHVVGMQDSKTIVSINIDVNAPLNSISDYIIIENAQSMLMEFYNRLK